MDYVRDRPTAVNFTYPTMRDRIVTPAPAFVDLFGGTSGGTCRVVVDAAQFFQNGAMEFTFSLGDTEEQPLVSGGASVPRQNATIQPGTLYLEPEQGE
jgi:hypothetical protein